MTRGPQELSWRRRASARSPHRAALLRDPQRTSLSRGRDGFLWRRAFGADRPWKSASDSSSLLRGDEFPPGCSVNLPTRPRGLGRAGRPPGAGLHALQAF